MGQDPNVELDLEAHPRPVPEPEAPRRWSPHRPGEIDSPEAMPWGGAFGRPGPDTGYVLRLVERADFERPTGVEDEVERLVASVAAARASLFGRGPIPEDVEVGVLLLGLRADGIPADVLARLEERRRHAIHALAHEPTPGEWLLERIPVEVLADTPEGVLDRLRSGERVIDR